MGIYKQYIANEAAEEFYMQKRNKVTNFTRLYYDGSNDTKLSYPSENMFESLAKTNPELFDKEKIEALKNSKNILVDFNKYYYDLVNEYIKSGNEFIKKNDNLKTDKAKNSYLQKFNTSIDAMLNDIQWLKYNGFYTGAQITKMINEVWIPDSLTEEGCRKLIDIRIQNNKILTEALTEALKTNHKAFNISSAEALTLINKLNKNKTNASAIGKVKEMINNPKILKNFRLDKNNYDFRSIGGCCMFLSEDPSIQFSQHPSKNLMKIFQYDAIVVAHGTTVKKSAPGSFLKVKYGYNFLYKRAERTINNALINIEIQRSRTEEGTDFYNLITNAMHDLEDLKAYFINNMKNGESRDADKIAEDIYIRTDALMRKYNMILYQFQFDMYDIINNIKARKDEEMKKLDGNSVTWAIQPVSTLSHSNMVRLIDVIRALKQEGFRNIYIGACNPKGVKLPKDIVEDEEFKVSFGMASVYLEDYMMDDELSLTEEYIDDMLEGCEESINETTIGEYLKDFIKNAMQALADTWKNIINFAKDLNNSIKNYFDKTFEGFSNDKLDKPVEISTLNIKSNKMYINTVKCNTPSDIQEEVLKANSTIIQGIQSSIDENTDYINKLNKLIDSGKLKKD